MRMICLCSSPIPPLYPAYIPSHREMTLLICSSIGSSIRDASHSSTFSETVSRDIFFVIELPIRIEAFFDHPRFCVKSATFLD